jgi:hypothetical protein
MSVSDDPQMEGRAELGGAGPSARLDPGHLLLSDRQKPSEGPDPPDDTHATLLGSLLNRRRRLS